MKRVLSTTVRGVITAISNREERDRRLPLVVSCWMRVEFKAQMGIPTRYPMYAHVDLRLSAEAYAVVHRSFAEFVELPHVVAEYDENHNVSFLCLPWEVPGEECETRTIQAMVDETNGR